MTVTPPQEPAQPPLPAQPPESQSVALPRPIGVAIVGIFLILLAGALYYARAFFLPLVLAMLIALAFLPLVRYLKRRGVPASLSAILIVVGLGGSVVAGSVLLADPVSQMVTSAPEIAAQLKERFRFLQRPLAQIVAAGEQVQNITQPAGDGNTQKVEIATPGVLSWAAETISGIGTTIGVTLLFVVFLLSSGDVFLHKLVRAVSSLSDKKRSVRIVLDIQAEVSRYLLTITVINLTLGICVGSVMAILGMPNPVLWGVAAAVLNYVPYIGAITGIGLATAVSLVTFPSLTVALIPPLAYFALHLIESAFITPLVLGRRLELNAVAILIALAFGGWMWGIVGALLGVPLLVVIKVFCDHFPSLATFGDFLTGAPPADQNGKDEAPPAAAG